MHRYKFQKNVFLTTSGKADAAAAGRQRGERVVVGWGQRQASRTRCRGTTRGEKLLHMSRSPPLMTEHQSDLYDENECPKLEQF